jgi:hypothetical protein
LQSVEEANDPRRKGDTRETSICFRCFFLKDDISGDSANSFSLCEVVPGGLAIPSASTDTQFENFKEGWQLAMTHFEISEYEQADMMSGRNLHQFVSKSYDF